jgi:hypothetical protein
VTQAAPTMLDIASSDFGERFGLDDGSLLILGEALSVRYCGLHFFQRFDFSEPDPHALARSIDAQLERFGQQIKRKAQRTPRCYFPREEKP